MKKILVLFLSLILVFALAGCESAGTEADTIQFHDKTLNKSDLSQETIEWLNRYNELTEAEQLAISSIPYDLYNLLDYPDIEEAEAVITETDESLKLSDVEQTEAPEI
ncbi:MAG: hypothetical protein IJC39_02830 [Firmicutes bacterium]|nr:hypothetical protein [Bacillota bacterium]